MPDETDAFGDAIASKALRKLRAQRAGTQSAWFGLGTLGVIGWSVAVPTLGGAFAGAWLDRHHPRHSWTLALLVAGLVIGCFNAWHWISAQNASIHSPPGPADE